MNRTLILTSFVALVFSACTTQTVAPTNSPAPTTNPISTENATPTPISSSTPSASPSTSAKATAKPSSTVKAEVKSENTVRSNTNININSNGVKVEITNKNGQKYAKVTIDGKEQEVKLDANGCYDYNNNGNKIHACNN